MLKFGLHVCFACMPIMPYAMHIAMQIEFIGPRPNQMRLMGDKSTAKDTMKASVSVVV